MWCELLESRDLPSILSPQQIAALAGIPLTVSQGPAPVAEGIRATTGGQWFVTNHPAQFGTGSPYVTADIKPLAESPGNGNPPPSALVFYLEDPYLGFVELGGATTAVVDGMTPFAAHQVTITDSLGNVVWQASFDGSQPLYLAVDQGIFGTGLGQFSIFVTELDAQGNALWTHLSATVFLGQFANTQPPSPPLFN